MKKLFLTIALSTMITSSASAHISSSTIARVMPSIIEHACIEKCHKMIEPGIQACKQEHGDNYGALRRCIRMLRSKVGSCRLDCQGGFPKHLKNR